jgi:hypothetical protein
MYIFRRSCKNKKTVVKHVVHVDGLVKASGYNTVVMFCNKGGGHVASSKAMLTVVTSHQHALQRDQTAMYSSSLLPSNPVAAACYHRSR